MECWCCSGFLTTTQVMCWMIALSDCLNRSCTMRCQSLPALVLCVTENWAEMKVARAIAWHGIQRARIDAGLAQLGKLPG